MKCAIMQPTYMPWAGYFNLIAEVDHFVFLDDVQFEKQSWQSRNRVLLGGRVQWLIVPVRHGSLADPIHSISVDDTQPWRRKQLTLLENAYARHPFRDDILRLARDILQTPWARLADLNMSLIRRVASQLGLSAQFHRASELPVAGPRSQRLVGLCRHLDCDRYLSPVGSAEYLAEDGAFESADVALSFQDYPVRAYPQKGVAEFISHLSVLDVVANLGWSGTADYIRCA
ncbi:MAG: WbqC family protein [Burkholderiales bacterium]|nr:WbqC family protein [Burkholderiales bacterium]